MMLDAMKEPDLDAKEDPADNDEMSQNAKLDHKGKRDFDEVTLVATAMVMLVAPANMFTED